MKKIIIVAGSTASGKTKFAINLAQQHNGEIINCDSLQLYKDLQILTAYPTQEEQKQATHKLFGYLECYEQTTAVDWAKKAADEITKSFANEKQPIITGGTGFYINTLINGISPIPQSSDSIRQYVANLAKKNYEKLCEIVYSIDKEIIDIITPDKHRQILRAYEVFLTTGKSILEYYKMPKIKFLNNVQYDFHIVDLDLSILYLKIEKRFQQMIQIGAIEEIKSILIKYDIKDTQNITNNFPIFRAVGAIELTQHILFDFDLEKMIYIACSKTKKYARRQKTWLRTQLPSHITIKYV